MIMVRLRSRVLSTALVVVFAAVTGMGVTLAASRASAVFTDITETGTPGYLALARDTATPLWSTLEPGQSAHWLIRASLNGAATGELAIELRGSGELIDQGGLTGSVDACTGSYNLETLTCSGLLTPAVASTPLRDLSSAGQVVKLANIEQASPRELLVTVTLPTEAQLAAGTTQTARIGLGVHASGNEPRKVTPVPTTTPPSTPPRLTVTGADLLPIGVLAAGLIGLGATLAFRRRVQ